MAEWQPISTAPKDGTEILAAWPGGRRITRWEDDRLSSKPKPHWRVVPFGGYSVRHIRDNQPKFWMPLPPPPSEQEG